MILNQGEQALVCAVADAFFPAGGPIPLSGSQAGVLAYVDGYVRRSLPLQRTLIRLLLLFIETSPIVFGPRMRRFTRLSHAERIAFLDGAFGSRIYFRRLTFVSMRAMMTMAYLSNERVAATMEMIADTDPFGIGDQVLEQRPLGLTA